MTMQATVRELWMHGFEIGPHPGETCLRCPDLWGEHILFADGAPIDGGWFECYLSACDCEGMWHTTPKKGAPDAPTQA
jgi:hypothetical protein